jgi:hypothetical protein
MFRKYNKKTFRIIVLYQYLFLYLFVGYLMKLSVAGLSSIDLSSMEMRLDYITAMKDKRL